jgi:hypothetical protein
MIRTIAFDVAQAISDSPGARTLNFDWMEPARQLRVLVDQEQARQLGLSSAAVSATLNAVITGSVVTQVRDDIYLINVLARATAAERLSLDTLLTMQVPIPGGRTVALGQFATFEYGQEYPLVWRRDRVPALTVQADVRPGVLPDRVVAEVVPRLAAVRAGLPAGTITYGDVLTTLPFGNTLATATIRGGYLLAALENGFVLPGSARFPQVAGLRLEVDMARPAGQRIVAAEITGGERRGRLDPERAYRIVTNNFLRLGGDGYAVLRDQALEAYDNGPLLEEVVADFLATRTPIAPQTDGRIALR